MTINFNNKNEIIEYANKVGLHKALVKGNCRVLVRRINYHIEENNLPFEKCVYQGWDGK